MSSVRNFYASLRKSDFWKHTIWYGVTWFLSAALINCGYRYWIIWTAIWYVATALFLAWSTVYFWWSDVKLRRLQRQLDELKAANDARESQRLAKYGLKVTPGRENLN